MATSIAAPTRELNRRSKVKLDKIAVLTDLSQSAENGLRHAAGLARAYSSELLLMQAYPAVMPPFANPGKMVSSDPEQLEANKRLLERKMNTALEALFLKGLRTQALLRHGTINQVMESARDVDLIVIGMDGVDGFQKGLSAPTAEKLFRSSGVPVLTVGPHCFCSGSKLAEFRTILFATHRPTSPNSALRYALSIAGDYMAKLILLDVEPDATPEFSFNRARVEYQRLLDLYKMVPPEDEDLPVKPGHIVAFGDPAELIVEQAKRHNADLIVMGVHKTCAHGAATADFAGGTAYRAALEAPCPVLTVKGL